jgi:hypothetical protein
MQFTALFWIAFWMAIFGGVVAVVEVRRRGIAKWPLLWGAISLTLYAVYHMGHGLSGTDIKFKESIILLLAAVVLLMAWKLYPSP